MKNILHSAIFALTGIACLAGTSAYGMMITNPVLAPPAGVFTKYIVDPSDSSLLKVDNNADLNTVLMGDSSDPEGNVELGSHGSSPPTVLSGELDGQAISLSGLVFADWTDNGNELANAYITDAAASADISLTPAQLAAIVANFLFAGKWEAPSDPNIGYVNLDDGVVRIGLQGLFDATSFLQGLLPPGTPSLPDGLQVSEVVKVDFAGETSYLYGFFATATGRTPGDGSDSYSGNYEVTIPEPGTLALVAVGLFGIARRRALL